MQNELALAGAIGRGRGDYNLYQDYLNSIRRTMMPHIGGGFGGNPWYDPYGQGSLAY